MFIFEVLLSRVDFQFGLNIFQFSECEAKLDSLIVESCAVGEENDIQMKWRKKSSYQYVYDISGDFINDNDFIRGREKVLVVGSWKLDKNMWPLKPEFSANNKPLPSLVGEKKIKRKPRF